MTLVSAGDDRLAGLFIPIDTQVRIFVRQARQDGKQLLLIGLPLRLDRYLQQGPWRGGFLRHEYIVAGSPSICN
ncbi:hypothetical protein [Mesorhizobium sp. M1A.F.Ca.ET.072.01.1.1]|uniref:hypothetical protein n=1 Tax=Mesorhizobium sp. M1A.F.Ca.ET.072.01.1.1 TaxID=2496753 RepID=UPI001FDF339B|nr:hypothetical protein [Mesorhizobium sp. M1A.F.Ca.ET.072.01.1.1]